MRTDLRLAFAIGSAAAALLAADAGSRATPSGGKAPSTFDTTVKPVFTKT